MKVLGLVLVVGLMGACSKRPSSQKIFFDAVAKVYSSYGEATPEEAEAILWEVVLLTNIEYQKLPDTQVTLDAILWHRSLSLARLAMIYQQEGRVEMSDSLWSRAIYDMARHQTLSQKPPKVVTRDSLSYIIDSLERDPPVRWRKDLGGPSLRGHPEFGIDSGGVVVPKGEPNQLRRSQLKSAELPRADDPY